MSTGYVSGLHSRVRQFVAGVDIPFRLPNPSFVL